MKQVSLLQLLMSLAAGAPVVQRQDAGVDATALGQSWIQKIENFVDADKKVGAETKKALINNMSKCSLRGIEPLKSTASIYQPICPKIFDGNDVGDAADATTLGQAWIAAVETAMGKNEGPQTRQKLLDSIVNCTVERNEGLLLGDPDVFRTYCPSLLGDDNSLSATAAPVPQKQGEKAGGKGKKEISAEKPFLEPASLSESDEICGPLSGASGVDEKGTSEACVGTDIFCRKGYYRTTSEDFANADECLNSRVDPDGITFSYN